MASKVVGSSYSRSFIINIIFVSNRFGVVIRHILQRHHVGIDASSKVTAATARKLCASKGNETRGHRTLAEWGIRRPTPIPTNIRICKTKDTLKTNQSNDDSVYTPQSDEKLYSYYRPSSTPFIHLSILAACLPRRTAAGSKKGLQSG